MLSRVLVLARAVEDVVLVFYLLYTIFFSVLGCCFGLDDDDDDVIRRVTRTGTELCFGCCGVLLVV